MQEESSVDTGNQRYNDLSSLEDVLKVNKIPKLVTPSRKVFDTVLPDVGLNMPKIPT